MAYKMTVGDENVVKNLRFKHGDKVAQYSDIVLAVAWREFSGSDDYPDEEKFLKNWLDNRDQLTGFDISP